MVAVQAHFIPLEDEMGKLKLVAEVFTPIQLMNRETRIVENLYSMAYHDALTKMPNRLFLKAVLKTRFSEYHRLQEPFALLFRTSTIFMTLTKPTAIRQAMKS